MSGFNLYRNLVILKVWYVERIFLTKEIQPVFENSIEEFIIIWIYGAKK